MSSLFNSIAVSVLVIASGIQTFIGNIITDRYYMLDDGECETYMVKSPVDITISAVGDCTLGYDIDFGYSNSFVDVVSRNGLDYPFKNVIGIFKNDDITVANLETTLTKANKRAVKEFKFKGDPEYAKMLNMSSIETVNISNNHIYDYLDEGFNDTINSLKGAKVGYFGEGNKYIKNVKGIKVGFLGYTGWSNEKSKKEKIYNDIKELKSVCRIVVVNFHWGIERTNYPNNVQQDLGRFCIDSGADLVIGEHPHVIQGLETYKGKHIVYSMGNFAYGGHKNPPDKDTFIFREEFEVTDNEVRSKHSEVLPCSVSSIRSCNNYQPTPLSGSEGERVLERLKEYSSALEYGYEFK